MKTVRKLKKQLVILAMTLIIVLGNSISAHAASCKNPTVDCGRNKITCTQPGVICDEEIEYVEVCLHKGHKLKELKVDGKDILSKQCACKMQSNYSNGKCKNCGTKITTYDLLLKKGTHKIEVKDDKGYWVTTYVTIKQKGCKHVGNGQIDHTCNHKNCAWCKFLTE